MINKNWMPENTRKLFEFLFNKEELTNAVLVGGTALSIQVGHRLSEDLDFAFFTETLPCSEIKILLTKIRTYGFQIEPLISQSQISQARINGIYLLDYVQDYNISGAKLSFFTFDKGGKQRKNYFLLSPKIEIGACFKVFAINELFESKCVVLRDRVKSRDLYDLMYLIKNHNYTIEDIFKNIKKIDDPLEGLEPIKEVLVGNVPIDKNDTGLLILNDDTGIDNIYEFFQNEINQYEIKQAKAIKKSGTTPDMGI